MKTEQLIPLCRRYHAMLLHSDEQTISIAVVNTPPAELMEALRFATQKRIDIECWSQEQMDKRLQAQEKQAQLAQNDGPENIAERVNQILEQALRQRASDIHIEPTRQAEISYAVFCLKKKNDFPPLLDYTSLGLLSILLNAMPSHQLLRDISSEHDMFMSDKNSNMFCVV